MDKRGDRNPKRLRIGIYAIGSRKAVLTGLVSLFIAALPVCAHQTSARVYGRQYWESHAPEHVIYEVRTSKPLVGLTFDDGPDPTYTPLILRELSQHHAHATFFVVGEQAQAAPSLLNSIVKSDDELANHTYHHQRGVPLKTDEITLCDEVILHATGTPSPYFRPPGGNLTPQIVDVSRRTRHHVIMWVDDSRDWSRPGVSKIVQNVMDNVHPGAIILFHDGGGDRRQTVSALAKVLSKLEEMGYQAVTVSELQRNRARS